MSLYEKNWWKKLVGKKEKLDRVDTLKDVQAISEFLWEIKDDTKNLLTELKKLEELEKENKIITREGLLLVNLQAQGEILDRILKRYQYFQDDVDINGIRIKNIAKEFLKKAEKVGLKDLVREKQQDPSWKLEW